MRRAHGMTRIEMAEQSGVSEGAIEKIEKYAGYDPKLTTLKKLAKFFNVSIDYIAYGQLPKSKSSP